MIRIGSAPGGERFLCQRSCLVQRLVAHSDHRAAPIRMRNPATTSAATRVPPRVVRQPTYLLHGAFVTRGEKPAREMAHAESCRAGQHAEEPAHKVVENRGDH